VSYLNSKKAGIFCLVTGIFLLVAGFYLTQGSPLIDLSLSVRQTWYLITGLALSVSGVVQLLREESF
jgi:predicted phage tail protein